MVGAFFRNKAGPDTNTECELHAEPFAFIHLVANDVTKLGTVRNRCGNSNLSTGRILLFVNMDTVTITCCSNCCL